MHLFWRDRRSAVLQNRCVQCTGSETKTMDWVWRGEAEVWRGEAEVWGYVWWVWGQTGKDWSQDGWGKGQEQGFRKDWEETKGKGQ